MQGLRKEWKNWLDYSLKDQMPGQWFAGLPSVLLNSAICSFLLEKMRGLFQLDPITTKEKLIMHQLNEKMQYVTIFRNIFYLISLKDEK